MADKAISQLTPASVLNDNDLLVLEQSNTAKKMAGSVLRTYIEGMGGIQSITLNANYTLTVTFTNGQTWTSGSIRGQTGNGITGIVLNDDYTLTVTYSDGNTWTSGSIRGQQGETGDSGVRVQTTQPTEPVVNVWIDTDGEPDPVEFTTNKVTSMSASSTNTQYPSAKCVYDAVSPKYEKPSGGIPASDLASGVIPTVPTNVSAFTNDAGYLTSHQDISGKEDKSNKVTSLSSSSTDTQYPSAKCVYDGLATKQGNLPSVVNDRYLHTNSSTGALEWATGSSGSTPDLGTINISTSWTGSASPYTQTVTVTGATVTANSKVDIQPSSAVLAQMLTDGCNALYIDNNNGVLTLYAVGAGLTVAQSNVQVCVTEVTA